MKLRFDINSFCSFYLLKTASADLTCLAGYLISEIAVHKQQHKLSAVLCPAALLPDSHQVCVAACPAVQILGGKERMKCFNLR